MKIPKAFEHAGRPAQPKTIIRSSPQAPELGMPPQEVTPATDEEISRIDTSWLPFAAKTYHISPNLEDYIIVNQMICPSDLPNRNGVSFPIEELVRFLPPPMNRQVFKAWAGCPVHEEHDNEDCTKAVGVIFDTSIRKIKGYGDGKHWAVYGLLGIDKNKYPQLAAEVASGKINTGSMGCMADEFRCSVCGSKASDNAMLNCAHISSTKDVNWRYVVDAGVKKLAFLQAYGLSPIEYSVVRDPAWATCLSDTILKAEEPTNEA